MDNQESSLNTSEIIVKVQISRYDNGVLYRVCPHSDCREEKSIEEFGWRRMQDGTIRNQSYCIKCRSKYQKENRK